MKHCGASVIRKAEAWKSKVEPVEFIERGHGGDG